MLQLVSKKKRLPPLLFISPRRARQAICPHTQSLWIENRKRLTLLSIRHSICLQNEINLKSTAYLRLFLMILYFRQYYDCYGPINQRGFLHKLFEHPQGSGMSRRMKTPFSSQGFEGGDELFWPWPYSNQTTQKCLAGIDTCFDVSLTGNRMANLRSMLAYSVE